MSEVIHVTMLEVLREPFEEWLRTRHLELVRIPETPADTFMVIPDREILPEVFPRG
jgi:hypothetical protein